MDCWDELGKQKEVSSLASIKNIRKEAVALVAFHSYLEMGKDSLN